MKVGEEFRKCPELSPCPLLLALGRGNHVKCWVEGGCSWKREVARELKDAVKGGFIVVRVRTALPASPTKLLQ